MRVRTTTAALLLALVVPVSGAATAAPAAIDVVPHRAPRDGHPTAPWVDLAHQVIHDSGRTVSVAPPLPKPLVEAWATAGGYLARDSSDALYRVAADGTPTVLVAHLAFDEGDVAVENGGQRVAVAVPDDAAGGGSFVDVYATGDGSRLARLQVGSPGGGVFGFRNGVVTLAAPLQTKKYVVTQVATWDVSGQAVVLGGKALRNPQLVDVDAGLMARAAKIVFGPVTVVTLATGRPRWTAPVDFIGSVSPNGRWVAAYTYPPKGERRGLLSLRNARNGTLKRSFRVDARDFVDWESDRSVLVDVFDPTRRKSALVRLGLGGSVERVSGYAKHPDRLLTSP